MSTCLLSVVLDQRGPTPRLYQVLCLNPDIISGPCSYHDGLSLPPSPRKPASLTLHSASYFPSVSTPDDDDCVFASDVQSTLSKPPNLWASPQVRRRFEDECDELQWKLSQRRATVDQSEQLTADGVDSDGPTQTEPPVSPASPGNLIPAINITVPSDHGLFSPFFNQPQNVDFVFEDVLEFWKSFEYVKVRSYSQGYHTLPQMYLPCFIVLFVH